MPAAAPAGVAIRVAVCTIILPLVSPAVPGSVGADLATDRDAFTPASRTVLTGTVLTELSQIYIDNRVGPPTNNFPELLVRFGTRDRWEWRLGFNYGIGSQGNVVTSVEAGEGSTGGALYESNMIYGFKVDLTEQAGWLPRSCLIMEGTTPTYGPLSGTLPVATAVTGWELPVAFPGARDEPWRLDGAVRYTRVEGKQEWFDRWSPSAVLRMPLSERLEAHLEWFGSFTQGLRDDLHQPFFSPGGHILLTENVELGLRVGWALSRESAPFFSDAGLAVRY